MKKHVLVLLASLLIVVALSGCVELLGFGGVGVEGGIATGVVIKRFSPDISEIFSEDSVVFSLSAENIGGEDATNVQAKLFGLGTDWTGADWVDTAERTKSIGFLEKSQPEYKVPGGVGDAQWDVTSPVGLKVDNTYTAGVRLSYGYSTTALANIKIYHNDYLKSNPEDAETIMRSSGIETFTVTNAPIKVKLAGLARPLIYRGEGQKASITVLLSNVGQGKPYKTAENDMTITVTNIEVHGGECEGSVEKDYRLPRAGEKSIPCRFILPYIDSYTTIPMEIELSYNYFLDGTTSIKVLKSIYIGGETTTTEETTTTSPSPTMPSP